MYGIEESYPPMIEVQYQALLRIDAYAVSSEHFSIKDQFYPVAKLNAQLVPFLNNFFLSACEALKILRDSYLCRRESSAFKEVFTRMKSGLIELSSITSLK